MVTLKQFYYPYLFQFKKSH